MESKQPIIPHLFRTEYRKIVAVLCKSFGFANIQLAEDVVADTFLKASETWGLKGVPKNPKAWIYTVAKNKANDYFKRQQLYQQKIVPQLERDKTVFKEIDINLSSNNIEDSQLQMLFTVCNPIISTKAQITFALKVLCGFGIDEISTALLSTKSTINKRLFRTKQAFKKHQISLQFPSEKEFENRLDNVLTILYLVFNEGYYSSTSEKTLQKELCIEAMRMLYMLLNNKTSNTPKTNALMALFCFHSSRFNARKNQWNEPILYAEQDAEKWDADLIEKGNYFLQKAANGNVVSKYHLEASIAYWHTQKNENLKVKWENILQLYNRLIQIEYSPITALNRTYALSMVHGKKVALKEALKIDLKELHLYHTLLAELCVKKEQKLTHLTTALKIADTQNDKKSILKKIAAL